MKLVFIMLWAATTVMTSPSIAPNTDCELVILLRNGEFLSAASVRKGDDGWIFLELDQGGTLGLPATEVVDVRYRCCRIDAQTSPRAERSPVRRARVATAGETEWGQRNESQDAQQDAVPNPDRLAGTDDPVAERGFPGRFRDSIPWWEPRARRSRRDPYLDRRPNDRLAALRSDIPWWHPWTRYPKPDPYLEKVPDKSLDRLRQDIPSWRPHTRFPKPNPYLE